MQNILIPSRFYENSYGVYKIVKSRTMLIYSFLFHLMENLNSDVYIVGGLLYGDEGKGTTVEYLVNEKSAGLVVRFNGGPQAAHHIVLSDKTFHCFSQFGSGTFNSNCHTLMSKYMLIYPHTMLREAKKLIEVHNVSDLWQRTHIDYECFVITPYHQMINRICEVLRGSKRHGTTGLGVGVCADEAYYANPDFFPLGEKIHEMDKLKIQIHEYTCLQVKDLVFLEESELQKKINKIMIEKVQQAKYLIKNFKNQRHFNQGYLEIYKNEIESIDDITRNNILKHANNILVECLNLNLSRHLCDFYLKFVVDHKQIFKDGKELIKQKLLNKEIIIFEGAQGALLDRVYGIYPHLTKTLCSDDNAISLLKQVENIINREIKFTKIGVLRAYSSRHGNGPFITHIPEWSEFLKEDHNMNTMWQGEFKVGPFDIVGARYGIEIFKPDYLSITCLDRLVIKDNSNINAMYPFCIGYKLNKNNSNDISLDDNLFEYEEKQIEIEITKIIKRSVEKSYCSLDLLKSLKDATSSIKHFDSLSEYETDIFDKLKFLNYDYYKITQFSTYLSRIQMFLNVPIAITSFGPTYKDKIKIIEI